MISLWFVFRGRGGKINDSGCLTFWNIKVFWPDFRILEQIGGVLGGTIDPEAVETAGYLNRKSGKK